MYLFIIALFLMILLYYSGYNLLEFKLLLVEQIFSKGVPQRLVYKMAAQNRKNRTKVCNPF